MNSSKIVILKDSMIGQRKKILQGNQSKKTYLTLRIALRQNNLKKKTNLPKRVKANLPKKVIRSRL